MVYLKEICDVLCCVYVFDWQFFEVVVVMFGVFYGIVCCWKQQVEVEGDDWDKV